MYDLMYREIYEKDSFYYYFDTKMLKNKGKVWCLIVCGARFFLGL